MPNVVCFHIKRLTLLHLTQMALARYLNNVRMTVLRHMQAVK